MGKWPLDLPIIGRTMLHPEGVETMEPNENLTTGSSGSPAAGNWLSGWSGLAVCAVAIVGAVLVFGGSLGGTPSAGKLLSLLFLLPCAIMMFMCMRNMGGNHGETGGSNPKPRAPKIGPGDGR